MLWIEVHDRALNYVVVNLFKKKLMLCSALPSSQHRKGSCVSWEKFWHVKQRSALNSDTSLWMKFSLPSSRVLNIWYNKLNLILTIKKKTNKSSVLFIDRFIVYYSTKITTRMMNIQVNITEVFILTMS